MRSTIDVAGRVVIPKAIRDAAGLAPGTSLEIELHDGRIELAPAGAVMHLRTERGGSTIEAEGALPTLTSDDVRTVLERTRR